MIKDTIDVLVENQMKEAEEFIKDIIIKKTGFNGNKDDNQEIIEHIEKNKFELECNEANIYKIKQNGETLSVFEIKTNIESNGFNVKATMWLEEVEG